LKTILSLFDLSGIWSKPYQENGYQVIKQDLETGQDIFEDTLPMAIADAVEGNNIYGILAAVPCTDFAGSGARWWKIKEHQPADYGGDEVSFDNTIEMSVAMVLTVLFIVELFKPVFWSLEQPVGRLHKLVPEVGKPKLYFHPYEFGDAYTKKTVLYGNFNLNLKKNPVEPIRVCPQGSWIQQLGGKSKKTKMLRSATPEGFAKSFYEANR
jgi:hypothetical protein